LAKKRVKPGQLRRVGGAAMLAMAFGVFFAIVLPVFSIISAVFLLVFGFYLLLF